MIIMKLYFFKYEGAGNDFILVDNRDQSIDHQQSKLINRLCDRRFGIGADGMIFLQNKEGFDFEMVYYNADGRPSSMCGNGGRCIVAFAQKMGIINCQATFWAMDGSHDATISEKDKMVSLQMIDVHEITAEGDAYVLNTGSPHYVVYAHDLEHQDVYAAGKAIRYSPTYASEGINVNFVEDMGAHYFVRTYERGVEDETYACGTGVTAVAMAMAKQKEQVGLINTRICALGGTLDVCFQYDGHSFTNVFLKGPATFVFEGVIDM